MIDKIIKNGPVSMANPDDPHKTLYFAKQGDEAALGRLLDIYRPMLKNRIREQFNDQLQRRVDESDIVQQTYTQVIQNFAEFAGRSPEQFLAWLLQIHDNNLIDFVRHHKAQKRAIDRETPQSRMDQKLPAEATTPSQHLARGERKLLLNDAIALLPDDQREAISLRHLQELSIPEIAENMQRTEAAIGGLLKRGMKALKTILADEKQS